MTTRQMLPAPGFRRVGTMVKLVAENVEAVLQDCGHFVPEESPDEIVRRVLTIVRTTQR